MSVTFSIINNMNMDTDPNFSNANARQILDEINVPYDEYLCDSFEGERLNAAISGALKALNRNHDYSVKTSEGEQIIMCGTTDNRVRERIRALLQLMINAKTIGQGVSFG